MNVDFTLAQQEDLAILMTYMEAFHDFDHTEPFDRVAAEAAMRKVLLDKSIGRVWLIQQNAETVGYIALTLAYRLEYRGYYAFLDELFIREDKRGQGIGTAALDFLEKACEQLGVACLQLENKQDNERAGELYIRLGFELQDRWVFVKELPAKA
ncbi:MAG: GNAT family N-acetyltransferase [Cyanobacteria bacterium J06634_6]